MFLYRKRLRGKSLHHWIKETSKPLDPEILEALVIRLRAGDLSVATPIILHHMGLVMSIASQYATVMDDDGFDYVSEGFLAVVEACQDHKKLQDNNITGFIVSRIHAKIGLYIKKLNFRNRIEYKFPDLDSGTVMVDHKRFWLLSNDTNALEDLFETISKTPTERKILNLRYDGYNNEEIAKKLDMPKAEVYRIMEVIQGRFNANIPTIS